jgi:hypothetical protein
MQEMTSQIYSQGESSNASLAERVCHMELKTPRAPAGIDLTLEKPHPWLMKSHLPARIFQKQLTEGKAKFIVVMRNVKDNLVSFYHFHHAMLPLNFKGTWNDFFDHFKAKELLWGDWLEYNLSWWAYKDHPNVLIVNYEDMKKNQREVIGKVAEFCQKPVSDDAIDRIVEQTSFESMKQNPATNYRSEWHPHIMNFDISPFMRKGIVGDWKNYFTEEQNAFVEEHYLKEAAKHGIVFECTL